MNQSYIYKFSKFIVMYGFSVGKQNKALHAINKQLIRVTKSQT